MLEGVEVGPLVPPLPRCVSRSGLRTGGWAWWMEGLEWGARVGLALTCWLLLPPPPTPPRAVGPGYPELKYKHSNI